MQTQWRTGMSGVVGLDYTALESVLRLLGVKRTRWPALFDDVRVMELAAMKQINRND